jgi:hypothetical protein
VISTGEQLHAFITANAILRDCKMPKASAWDNLASEIEFLCIVDQQGKAMAAGARHKLQRALEVALESLPGIIEGADWRIELYRSLGWDEKGHITERTKLQTLQRAILAFVPQAAVEYPRIRRVEPGACRKDQETAVRGNHDVTCDAARRKGTKRLAQLREEVGILVL